MTSPYLDPCLGSYIIYRWTLELKIYMNLAWPSCGVVHMDQDVIQSWNPVRFWPQAADGLDTSAFYLQDPRVKSGCAEWPFFNGETNVSPLNGISLSLYIYTYRHTCMYIYICTYIYNVYLYIMCIYIYNVYIYIIYIIHRYIYRYE